jgi:tetratricopeptide (TPR) repeat protein
VLGRYDEARAAHLKVVQLDPAVAIAYKYLALSYISLNRLDEARSTIEQARARGLDSADFGPLLYEIDFLQNSSAGMAEQASHLAAGERLFLEASAAAYRGQLSHSRDLIRSAVVSATQANAKEAVAGLKANSAVHEALVGNLAEARRQATEALSLRAPADWITGATATLSLALAGDTAQVERLAADLNRRLPEATYVQFMYLPAIRAALALQQGKPLEAIENLRVGSSYELAPGGMFAVYLRGEAYLSARRGAEAAAEFQKILDHPGLVVTQPIGPLAHLGLGRACAMQGDAAKARTAYRDFFALWEDADPDIPILKQAKAEYAKLR